MGIGRQGTRRWAARWGAGAAAVGLVVAWMGLRPPTAEIRVVEGWAMPNHTGAAISLHPSADATADHPGLAGTVRPAATTPAPAMSRNDTATPHDPTVRRAPDLTVSAEAPFPWVVAVVAEDDRGWCVVAVRGTTAMPDRGGRGCDGHLHPDDDVGWTESASRDDPTRRLVWGVAPGGTENVVVQFADGTRRTARLAREGVPGATLWALGHAHGDVHLVEAQGDGWVSGTGALDDGWGVGEALAVLGVLAAATAVPVVATRRVPRRRHHPSPADRS